MCNFFGDLEYKDQAAVNKCNNFLFSLFLVISEIKKVSTCLESGISFDNFDLAFDDGGIYEYGLDGLDGWQLVAADRRRRVPVCEAQIVCAADIRQRTTFKRSKPAKPSKRS
jgi:hypothetical protein